MLFYINGIEKPYILVIDIEHDEGHMIQLAGIMVKNVGPYIYQVCRSINMYIKQPTLSHFIEDYTNITLDILNEYGVELEEAQSNWNEFLKDFNVDDILVVSHGIAQDSVILQNNGFNINQFEQLCTYQMSKYVLKRYGHINLSEISEEAGLAPIAPHNAYSDALTNLLVLSFLSKDEENNQ